MKQIIIIATIFFLIPITLNIGSSIRYSGFPTSENKKKEGIASYYDYKIGDWSSIGHRVCATRDFIRYSMVKVTNKDNNKSVTCKVLDYGPDESIFPERVVDLSSTAFSIIADRKLGTVNVIVEQL